MTIEEFSNSFSTLLNSFGDKFLTIELDEYEKSLFLTEAQEQIIKELYTGRSNIGSFEETEEIREYLKSLIKHSVITTQVEGLTGVNNNSKFYTLPTDTWFIIYETITYNDPSLGCKSNDTVIIKPISYDTYYFKNKNPFKKANKYKGFRLDYNDTTVEIVSNYILENYTVNYLSRPLPIILENLGDTTINGLSIPLTCSLHESLHYPILERAVNLAKGRYMSTQNNDNKTNNN